MNKKVQSVLRKTLKVIMWVALSFVLMFILIAFLIQIPSIQTKIVHFVTSYVSDKTNTKVEIKNVSISFPKSVVLEGIYLEDLEKDTLLYAGKAKINIALYDLLKNKIAINSFDLKNVNLNLHNSLTDSLFNYNFLLTAFGDTTVQAVVDTTAATKWTFGIEDVNLENIRLRYDDRYGGLTVGASLTTLELQINELDLEKSIYTFDDLLVENMTANVLMKESSYVKNTQESASTLPTISATKIVIKNSKVNYADSIGKQSVTALIDHFKLTDGTVDLQNEMVSINHLLMSESEIQYHSFATEISPDSLIEKVNATPDNNWKVSVSKVMLDDNSLVYKVGNKPSISNSFNADHLEYKNLTLYASDLTYSAQQTKVSVTEFSAVDQNGFAINSFETDFTMDAHSITASNIGLKTPNSTMEADFKIQYESLESLTQSMQFSNLAVDLRKAKISNSDLLYFNPDLGQQPFFKNKNSITTVTGQVNGPMNNLRGKNLVIHAGENTILKTDFMIKGMPTYKTAWYHFPNLKVVSGKKDIVMMAGPSIPENIAIPENISMEVTFKGKIKSFESTMNMSSSFGDANLVATIDPEENFSSKVNLNGFDVGRLMKDTLLYGPVTLTAEAQGKGLDINTIKGKIKAEVTEIYLNKYTYHNLKMEGEVISKQFEGTINLDDENAVFDFEGLVNINPDQEQYKFKLNVQGVDLKKLKLTDNDVQISFISSADLKGGTIDKMNGTAGITKIIVAREGKKYQLDSLLTASVNEPNKSKIKVSSALIDIDYEGTLSPIALPGLLNQFVNNYFPFSDSIQPPKENERSDFNFEIQVHNHPILSKVLLPQLKEFEPGVIKGSFDSEKNDLKLTGAMRRIVYGTTEINDFKVDVDTKDNALNYKLTSKSILNSAIKLDNFSLDGKLADKKLSANVSSTDGKKTKILLRSEISKNNGTYRFTLDPKNFYIADKQWAIADDNSIEFGKHGLKIHHFFIDHNSSQINIASVNNNFNDDLNIEIKNFKLENLSQIIEKDTSLVKGTVNGNVLLKRVDQSYGMISDIKVGNLIVQEVPIGDLSIKADNPRGDRFDIDVNLTGPDNNISMKGNYIPMGGANSLNINTAIQSLSLKTIEAFSMGQVTETDGILTGNFSIQGKSDTPDITGELVFKNAFMKPAFLNNRLEIKNETIEFKTDGIYFDSFTLTDNAQHTAVVDGSVKMKQFTDFIFALEVNTEDFQLFNTTAKDNKNFFGKMIIDSKIKVGGTMDIPTVNAKVKMKEGSNFTFSVPEDQLTTDKGENVVEFLNPVQLNPIMTRGDKKGVQSSGMSGFELASIVEIDKEATLRLLMDPTTSDSLVVKGEAALSFTMDQSGKMSLTGAYNLSEGSYLVSLESVIKKHFDINAGSTITWNGDPMDAVISINATYTVRTSPIDLVANQSTEGDVADNSKYRQRFPFQVLLKLRGEILKPEISFEIQVAPESKGTADPEVIQKLAMLNEDESALNKQVFALLVLGRFIQENPFETETAGGTSTLIRSTVSKFLSSQLNQLSSKMLPGTEINFDIQSYDEYETGAAKGRTEVEIGVKQNLFNERLSVEIGGSVDVEGDKRNQNSAKEIAGDVTIEYKLTKDGRFRMKGFRHNEYDALVGQLIETGGGLVYVRDFNQWSRLFKSQRDRSDTLRTRKDTLKQQNSDDTGESK